MPHVHNGIGTWYWGKTNIRTARGTCQFCKKTSEQRSYDTTKFFVVLFVPIVALGQKRVMSECPFCKRHFVLPLKKFARLREEEVGAAVEDYRKSPTDPAKAATAIAKAVSCEDEDQFFAVAEQIETSLARVPDVQTRLGAGYAFFGHADQAEAAYGRSYQLAPDPEVGDLLAVLYLRQKRADDAAPFLDHVIDDQQRDKIGYIYLLAEGYQAAGRHQDALTLLERVAVAFPGIETDAEFNKYRATSLKHRSSGKSVPSQNLKPVSARVIERRPLAVMLPRLIGPAIALVALSFYLFSAYSAGKSREVWFVNGLDRPYDVEVNGRRVHLPALGRVTQRFPEGDLNVMSLDPSVPLPQQTCRVQTAFASRPYANHMFVVNPDRAAIVYDEETTYSASMARNQSVDPHHMFVGDLLYTFSDVDYAFQEFPGTLSVSDKTGELHKKKVATWTRGSAAERMGVVGEEIGREAVGAYARNLALCNPQDSQFVLVATAFLPPDEALKFLQPRLGVRPVQVEWHRAYQELMQRVHPNVDLTAEYRPQLEKDPNNTALMYLLGRISEDQGESLKLFHKSVTGADPCAFGYFALAYDAMAHARFPDWLEMAHSALRLQPDNANFEADEDQALLANGKFDELLERKQSEVAASPDDQMLVIAEAQLLAARRRGDEAKQLVDGFYASHPGSQNSQQLQSTRARVDALLRYAAGDLPGYAAASASAGEASPGFEVAIATGRPDEAAAVLRQPLSDAASADSHLLVYLTAMAAQKTELAQTHLKAAAGAYATLGKEERRAAEWLTSANMPDPEVVCNATMRPDEKRILLAAMAVRDPGHRDRYFAAARTYNFDHTFPYLTIRQLSEVAAGG